MPEARVFTGHHVRLDPQVPEDAEELFRISHESPKVEALWRYLPVGPFGDPAEMAAFLTEWGRQPDVRAFTVRSLADGRALGSYSLMSLRPIHGVGELGNIWFTPAAQGTKANTECAWLLLKYCFEELGYRRMEWKCNAENAPSRKAALRLGFTFEGIFRQHLIVKGANRDTAWFSLLDDEWPEARAAMEKWLIPRMGENLPAGPADRLG
jgi:RimJ/RimL family protein N-acetyltransferase